MQNFGEPFLLIVKEDEKLASVKERIKKKLLVPDEEFSKVIESLDLILSFGVQLLIELVWLLRMQPKKL